MTVLFPRWANKLPTFLAAGAAVAGLLVVFVVSYYFSPRYTDVGYAPTQPVAYSHKLHAGVLGLDCRYCHHGVEKGPHATIPTTEVCMNCHSKVRTDSPKLQVVRDSWETGEPIPWVRVHMLPDYAYFNHSAHVTRGIGCASCHGRVDQMEVVWQAEPLNMGWCLECHRAPENHLRPLSEITNMDYVHDQAVGERIKRERGIQPPEHCSACHH